jgi:FkbM family methyltransferase
MNKNIKVSVAVPTYKFSKYIEECINSIQSQIVNFEMEIIVSDDFSEDGTIEILNRIKLTDDRIKIIQNKKNLGFFHNIKNLFDNCVGEYIAYIDGDDLFIDDFKLQKQFDFLENNKEFAMHSTGYKRIENGIITPQIEDCWFTPLKEELTISDIINVNLVSFGRMFRNSKNLVPDWANGYNFLDWIINFQILKKGKAKCESWVSGYYRLDSNGLIASKSEEDIIKENKLISDLLKIKYEEFLNEEIIKEKNKKMYKDYSQHGEQKIILDYFKDIDVNNLRFLDIGANDGVSFSNTYALALSGWSGALIEPSKMAFDKLEENYKENKSVNLYNVGISNKTEKMKFYESRNWVNADAPVSVLSSLDESHKDKFIGMNWEETQCDFVTWIDFKNKYGINSEAFDFISIDCEGHDLIVLDQIKEILDRTKIVCVESSNSQDSNLNNILKSNGFELMNETQDNSIYRKKEDKTVVMIDCFVSGPEVESKLIDQIERVKSINLDILLVSNTIIKKEIIELVDFYIYDKRNQLFECEYDNVNYINLYDVINNNDTPFLQTSILTRGLQRHGLSVLVNLFNSVNFAKSLGYDNFIRLEVDDLFGPESIKFIERSTFLLKKSNKKALLFYNNYDNESSNISFHFMNFNIDYFLEKIPQIKNESDYINYLKENYDNLRFEIAEQFIYNNLKRNGDVEVLIKNGQMMSDFFQDTIWNTSMSNSNLSSKYEGCMTTLFNLSGTNEIMILSYNKTEDHKNRKIKVVTNNGSIDFNHNLNGYGVWSYNLIDKNELIEIWVYESDRLLYVEKNENINNKVSFL